MVKRRAAPEEQSRRSSFSYLPLPPPLEPLPEPLPPPLLELPFPDPEPPPEPPFEPLPPPFVVEPVLAEPPEGWLKAVGRVVDAM
jgi:protein TonB